MKIENIKNVNEFFKVVDSCKGKVELVTGEGDRLNLRSKLSQYVSLANVFSDGNVRELEIVAYEPEDITKLIDYMMQSGKQCHLVNQFQIKIQWFSFRESHCFFSSKT